jgi:hypothetical protein
MASGDIGDDTVMLESNASADVAETTRAAVAAIADFMRIARFPCLRWSSKFIP